MKKLYVIMLAVFCGCAGVKPGEGITPERVNSIARLAAYGAATGALVDNPKTRKELEQARVIIATLVSARQWDIVQLAGAFQQAGFKELHGDKGVIIVTGAILAADLAGNKVDLRNSVYAEQAILGALDGLNLALGK